MIAAIAARAGLRDSATGMVRATRSAVRETRASLLPSLAFTEAYVYLLSNDTASCLTALETFLRDQPQRRAFVSGHVWFGALRDNKAFAALVGSQ
jgi:hypothetical protein